MPRNIGALLVSAVLLARPAQAGESRLDVGLSAAVRRLSELGESDPGIGTRLSYRVHRVLALDGELSVFPADLGSPAFTSTRLEALAGLRVGPRLGRRGGYLALRAGAVRFAAAPEPFACILIFPPPLECTLGAGRTVPTVQASAGFEAFPGQDVVVRVEAGDQLVRYPGPAFRPDGRTFENDFWSHNLKATVSVGVRF